MDRTPSRSSPPNPSSLNVCDTSPRLPTPIPNAVGRPNVGGALERERFKNPMLVAAALADALVSDHPSAVNAFAREDWGASARMVELLSTVRRATRVRGPELSDALEAIERASRAAARTVPEGSAVLPEQRRRYEAKRLVATEADLRLALDRVEREIERSATRRSRSARQRSARGSAERRHASRQVFSSRRGVSFPSSFPPRGRQGPGAPGGRRFVHVARPPDEGAARPRSGADSSSPRRIGAALFSWPVRSEHQELRRPSMCSTMGA